MNPLVFALMGAAGLFVILVLIASIIDVETREAVARLLSVPAVLLVYPFVRFLEHLPRAGRMRAVGIAEEINNQHFHKVGWGVAGSRWAVVLVRRTSEKLPVPLDRTP